MSLKNYVLDALGLKHQPTFGLQAMVIRKDGTVEDMGVIATGKVQMSPAAGSNDKEN